jgi:hypothetical protein
MPLAHAGQWDFSSGFLARNFPLGAAFVGEVGYSQKFWKSEAEGPVSKFLYGDVRSAVSASTSGVVNGAGASLIISPISFVSLGGRWGASNRLVKVGPLDCEALECRGTVLRSQLFGSIKLGAGPWGVAFETRSERLGSSTPHLEILDEVSTLPILAAGDHLLTSDFFTTFQLSDSWRVLAWLRNQSVTETHHSNQLRCILAQHTQGQWMTTTGIGLYQSTIQPLGLTVLGGIRWSPAL